MNQKIPHNTYHPFSIVMKVSTKNLVLLTLFIGMYTFGQHKINTLQQSNASQQWQLAFTDGGKKDWTKKWTLDGLFATIKNTKKGMLFSAGPEARNDAHHAVLWTKESFKGDIKIEYDYTRTDNENKWVNILYIQATGDGEGDFEPDISKWSKFREVPAMKTYFENMNALHISYAAFGNAGDGTYYVRARRYPKPANKSFNVTKISPFYDQQGYFETGKTYHITVIKSNNQLSFHMESTDKKQGFTWDLSDVDPITEGRIGLRHMWTRAAQYSNFKIYTK